MKNSRIVGKCLPVLSRISRPFAVIGHPKRAALFLKFYVAKLLAQSIFFAIVALEVRNLSFTATV